MATVNEKLTNLADEIRVLSGATDALSLTEMATHVGTANTDIAVMENLIEELEEALDGKSVTAGEDVTAETDTYTELLGDLEAAVDALPDAGSGGGASVETCSVVLAPDSDATIKWIGYTHVADNGGVAGVIESDLSISGTNRTIENVVCGSIMCAYANGASPWAEGQNVNIINGQYPVVFRAPTTAGSTGMVTIIDDD